MLIAGTLFEDWVTCTVAWQLNENKSWILVQLETKIYRFCCRESI